MKPLLHLLVACSACAAAPATGRVVARAGGGRIEAVGGQRVLVVRGTPYQMGWQHGRLLADQVNAGVAWARRELAFPRLRPHWRRIRSRVPGTVLAELRGLAQGAGVELEGVELAHFAAPMAAARARSIAAWGEATPDRRLYHAYDLAVPADGRDLPSPILVVAVPDGGVAYAYPSLPGCLLPLAGMNLTGLSAAAAPYGPSGRRGLPPPFAVKSVLSGGEKLEDAVAMLRAFPHSSPCAYVLGHARGPRAAVVEATRGLVRVVRSGDLGAAQPPHRSIPGVMHRAGHLLQPEAAAAQRQTYHPAYEAAGSYLRYASDEMFLIHYRGLLGPEVLRRLLRDRPPSERSLWQAVLSPAERCLWLAPGGRGGGAAPAFCRYPLHALVRGERFAAEERSPPARKPLVLGLCACEETLEELSDPKPATNKLLQSYNFAPHPFPWRMRLCAQEEHCTVYRLAFPSPAKLPMLQTQVVHGEYYVPVPAPRGAPAVVVLHILDGRFVVARLICRHFAAEGVPSLMLQMPYYGWRRPPGRSLDRLIWAKPRRMFDAMHATAMDLRRAACWLQQRPEVHPRRLGLVGVSLGAIAAALGTGVDPRFERTVLVLGGGDPAAILWHAPETRRVRQRLEELGYTLARVRELARPVDPVQFAHRVDPREVLMINARYDDTVPRQCTEALWEAMGKPAIEWRPAGHYGMSLFIPVVLPRALRFVRDGR
ncbi:MAG: C45 family autoproteolytic acyltransferase/hydrolase [Candidatus Brocadiia bacterium]